MTLGRPGPGFTGKVRFSKSWLEQDRILRINGFWIADAAKDDFVDFLRLGEPLIFWVSISAVS